MEHCCQFSAMCEWAEGKVLEFFMAFSFLPNFFLKNKFHLNYSRMNFAFTEIDADL